MAGRSKPHPPRNPLVLKLSCLQPPSAGPGPWLAGFLCVRLWESRFLCLARSPTAASSIAPAPLVPGPGSAAMKTPPGAARFRRPLSGEFARWLTPAVPPRRSRHEETQAVPANSSARRSPCCRDSLHRQPQLVARNHSSTATPLLAEELAAQASPTNCQTGWRQTGARLIQVVARSAPSAAALLVCTGAWPHPAHRRSTHADGAGPRGLRGRTVARSWPEIWAEQQSAKPRAAVASAGGALSKSLKQALLPVRRARVVAPNPRVRRRE